MPVVTADLAPATKSGSVVRTRQLTRIARERSLRGKILSVSPLRHDHTTLRNILLDTSWHLAAAGTCRRARTFLSQNRISIIVCERDLPDGTWRDILGLVANNSEPPLMIVTSRLADDRLWAEVINLGGYDVLAKPFQEREVRHVLTSARSQIECRWNTHPAGLA